jgi:hypothetical protein
MVSFMLTSYTAAIFLQNKINMYYVARDLLRRSVMARLPIEEQENGPILLGPTVVARALGRVGSREYQSLFIQRDNELGSEDVINHGEFACAYETTAALHNLGLLKATHTTVDGFEAEVTTSSDWIEINLPRAGAIGILEPKMHLDGTLGTRHTFTCITPAEAVHNEAAESIRVPQRVRIDSFRHHTGEQRAVERYFIHRLVLILD